jgi:hypothetical protein
MFYYSDQHRTETKPIKIGSSSNGNNTPSNGRPVTTTTKQSGSSFEDVKVDDSDDSFNSSPIKKQQSNKSKLPNSSIARHNNNASYIPKQHNFDGQMLLESMLDNVDEDQRDNNRAIKNNNRLSHKSQSNNGSNGVFLLLDANEHLTVSKFIQLISILINLLLLG